MLALTHVVFEERMPATSVIWSSDFGSASAADLVR